MSRKSLLMAVSRPTLTRIYNNAGEDSHCFVEGESWRIAGKYELSKSGTSVKNVSAFSKGPKAIRAVKDVPVLGKMN